jgi:hypothetical protein
MDVVWMAEFKNINFLNNKQGQSVVEYILLLAVISSIGLSFYNSKAFKEFTGGKSGLFAKMRQGMEYSYRYGRALDSDVDYEQAIGFEYTSNKHDTYFNSKSGASRFFAGLDEYGKM